MPGRLEGAAVGRIERRGPVHMESRRRRGAVTSPASCFSVLPEVTLRAPARPTGK
ncbi:hypothetical protein GCM10010392_53250 [Streptomyces clavifer]|nr:hypothetical protein GCM10010392_53250 [Streptomyces clavifer]